MRKSASLTEVIIGAVILATVFTGLIAVVVSSRKFISRASRRLTSANLIRASISDLYYQVRNDTLATGALSSGVHNISNFTIDNVVYTRNYTVNASVESGYDYRKVDMTASFPD